MLCPSVEFSALQGLCSRWLRLMITTAVRGFVTSLHWAVLVFVHDRAVLFRFFITQHMLFLSLLQRAARVKRKCCRCCFAGELRFNTFALKQRTSVARGAAPRWRFLPPMNLFKSNYTLCSLLLRWCLFMPLLSLTFGFSSFIQMQVLFMTPVNIYTQLNEALRIHLDCGGSLGKLSTPRAQRYVCIMGPFPVSKWASWASRKKKRVTE